MLIKKDDWTCHIHKNKIIFLIPTTLITIIILSQVLLNTVVMERERSFTKKHSLWVKLELKTTLFTLSNSSLLK